MHLAKEIGIFVRTIQRTNVLTVMKRGPSSTLPRSNDIRNVWNWYIDVSIYGNVGISWYTIKIVCKYYNVHATKTLKSLLYHKILFTLQQLSLVLAALWANSIHIAAYFFSKPFLSVLFRLPVSCFLSNRGLGTNTHKSLHAHRWTEILISDGQKSPSLFSYPRSTDGLYPYKHRWYIDDNI